MASFIVRKAPARGIKIRVPLSRSSSNVLYDLWVRNACTYDHKPTAKGSLIQLIAINYKCELLLASPDRTVIRLYKYLHTRRTATGKEAKSSLWNWESLPHKRKDRKSPWRNFVQDNVSVCNIISMQRQASALAVGSYFPKNLILCLSLNPFCFAQNHLTMLYILICPTKDLRKMKWTRERSRLAVVYSCLIPSKTLEMQRQGIWARSVL